MQHMIVRRALQQGHAQQRSVFEIEGFVAERIERGLHVIRTHTLAPRIVRRSRHLHRHAIAFDEMLAQAFVPCDQTIERRAHRALVQRALQAHRAGDVVRRARRIELP
ncbi:hypothetical protein YK56LOC_36200 [Caballeronia sp. HLA56]